MDSLVSGMSYVPIMSPLARPQPLALATTYLLARGKTNDQAVHAQGTSLDSLFFSWGHACAYSWAFILHTQTIVIVSANKTVPSSNCEIHYIVSLWDFL